MSPKIIIVPDLGSTPARVHRPSGTIYLNGRIFSNYADYEQKLIILHEQGHYELQTRDEVEADAYALEKFTGSELYSLKKALYSFYNTLDMKNPNHIRRYNEILLKVLQIDYYKYGNYKIGSILKIMTDTQLMDILTAFYVNKGIQNPADLDDEQKNSLLLEFGLLPEVQNLMQNQILIETGQSDYSDFNLRNAVKNLSGASLIQKVASVTNNVTNNVIKKAAGAMGVRNPKILNGIANLTNPANLLNGVAGGVQMVPTRPNLTQNQQQTFIGVNTENPKLFDSNSKPKILDGTRGGAYNKINAGAKTNEPTTPTLQIENAGAKTNEPTTPILQIENAGAKTNEPTTQSTQPSTTDSGKKTKIIIGVIVGLIIVGVVVYFSFFHKK